MNIQAARERLGHCDDATLVAIAEVLVGECGRRMTELREALQRNDSQEVMRAAHTVKGAVSVFEAKEVREKAAEIEVIASTGDLDNVPVLIDELQQHVTTLIGDLQQLMSDMRAGNP